MKLSLASKLYLTLVPLLLSAVVTALVTRTNLNTNAQELIEARELKELALQSLSYLFIQDDASKALLIDMENVDAGDRKIQAYDSMQAAFKQMQESSHSAEILKAIRQLEEMDKGKLRPLDTHLLEVMAGGQTDEAKRIYFKEYEPIRTQYETLVRQIVETAEKQAVAAARHMAEKNQRAFIATSSCLLVGLLVVATILVMITRRVTAHLKQTAESLKQQAEVTAMSTQQLYTASQTVADGANQQAASVQETSASLEQISKITKTTADNAQTAKTLASKTRATADASASDMNEMVAAMEQLRASNKGITEIIRTIDDIAFQTNILSLNAAVEAARAGEAGRGFAVVAEEVRRLAQRSAQAARETAEKIEDSLQKNEHGAQLSIKVSGNLGTMISSVHEVDKLIVDIAHSCQQQSESLTQISSAVESIDAITQSNASSAHESASTAESLAGQSHHLAEAVAGLQTLIYGHQKIHSSEQAISHDHPEHTDDVHPGLDHTADPHLAAK